MRYGDSPGRWGGLHRGSAGRLRALKEAAGEVLPLPLWGARLCRLGAVRAGAGRWHLGPAAPLGRRWSPRGLSARCAGPSFLFLHTIKKKRKKIILFLTEVVFFVVVWLCLFLVLFSNHQVGKPWSVGMSFLLPQLTCKREVDQAIKSVAEKVLVLRFGKDNDAVCLQLDDIVRAIFFFFFFK